MNAPVNEFINKYISGNNVRLHMPGHKGSFGYDRDITEVRGADSLYEADGIILESEKKTSRLFGSGHTFYSTEGSSHAIKAACYLALKNSPAVKGERQVIIATRNAHRAFINASMLLGFDIKWIYSGGGYDLCSCNVTAEDIGKYLKEYTEKNPGRPPAALYITTPDYLGNILDVKGISEVAKSYGTILITDNAHGAYLNFVSESSIAHPLRLGADICCDSAHKTLPVLTGGAYLHLSDSLPESTVKDARQALLTFGSTSPSYLILESLDMVSERVKKTDYEKCIRYIAALKDELSSRGHTLVGTEPLKITFDMRGKSLSGTELGDIMRQSSIEPEYTDRDFVVTMWSPYMDYEDAGERLLAKVSDVSASGQVSEMSTSGQDRMPGFTPPETVYMPYETLFLPHHTEFISDKLIGMVAADSVVSCPPAVSPVVAGQRIIEDIVNILKYYGIEKTEVLD